MFDAQDHSPRLSDLKRAALRAALCGMCGAVLLAGALDWALDLPPAHSIATLGLYLGCILVARQWLPDHAPHQHLGIANLITALRAGMVANLGGFLLAPPGSATTAWCVIGLAIVALILDGVDGWAARRTGQASAFGARIDQELDGLMMVILAALIWRMEVAGAWILIAGAWRYAFLILRAFVPSLRGELADSRRRRVLCGVAVGGLIACLGPIWSGPFALVLAGAVVAALSTSFILDIRWLWTHRKSTKGEFT
jgi:phosphatidylglycerophosphate synthase